MSSTQPTTGGEGDTRHRAVQNGMSEVEYDTWMFLADKKGLDEPYTFAVGQVELTRFLREYRLQVLDEVRAKGPANRSEPDSDASKWAQGVFYGHCEANNRWRTILQQMREEK